MPRDLPASRGSRRSWRSASASSASAGSTPASSARRSRNKRNKRVTSARQSGLATDRDTQMDVVNIFSSDAGVASLGEVQQAGKRLLFANLKPDGSDHLVDGPVWAFVDWVMEEMAGLEMCRR